MIDFIKNRIIIILGVLFVLSLVVNGIFVFVVWKQGLKITTNTYTTNTSQSNSYASSGSFVLNFFGQQLQQQGSWKIMYKDFNDIKQMNEFMKKLNFIQFIFSKIVIFNSTISSSHLWYFDFVDKVDEKKGIIKTEKKEVLGK